MNNKSRVFGLVLVLLLMATMVFAQEYNIKGVNIEVTSEVNAERFAIANELYGQDITIGELLEKVFPDALESRKRNLPPDVYEKLNSEPMVWEAENDIAPTSEVIGHISYIYSGNPINFNSGSRVWLPTPWTTVPYMSALSTLTREGSFQAASFREGFWVYEISAAGTRPNPPSGRYTVTGNHQWQNRNGGIGATVTTDWVDQK